MHMTKLNMKFLKNNSDTETNLNLNKKLIPKGLIISLSSRMLIDIGEFDLAYLSLSTGVNTSETVCDMSISYFHFTSFI
jgi:hypothetical protein